MQDMMHCLSPSLLERQRTHLYRQHQQQQQEISLENLLTEGGWPNLSTPRQYPINTREEVTTPSPTTSITTTSAPQVGKCSKKRKADKPPMVGSDDDEKRMKGDQGEKQQGDGSEDSGSNSSKENIVEKKPDYIHVRARRGQATDSHSLAERVRRERISERMKYLQGLVPGCNKITGKAGMLDEIINYVQSLQRQVEFLSMKLAAVNPRLDFNVEPLFTKEMNLPCTSNISTVGISPPSGALDPTFLQFHSLQQAMTSCGFDMDTSVSTPIPALATTSEPFFDSFINVQRSNVGWDNDLNNLYSFAFPFQGTILSNLKTEM